MLHSYIKVECSYMASLNPIITTVIEKGMIVAKARDIIADRIMLFSTWDCMVYTEFTSL